MKRVPALLTFAFLLSGAFAARAQNAPTAAPPAPPAMAQSYRLIWTITESDAGKRVSSQHFDMVLTTGGRTTAKLGSKVPVVTGSYSANAAPGVQTQFQYLDVGLNLDASLDDTPSGGLRLRSKVEQSSVAQEKSPGVLSDEPIIRQAVMEGTSLLVVGRSITLGSLDVPGSTHHIDISVTLETLK